MSELNDLQKLSTNSKADGASVDVNHNEQITDDVTTPRDSSYAVTVSQNDSATELDQKSFISIHSTDQLRQVTPASSTVQLDECNVEVISLNEVFPETSEESLSNIDELPLPKKKKGRKSKIRKEKQSSKCPVNSTSAGELIKIETQMTDQFDFDIAKGTIHVMGSNPGEPKICYTDPPKKMSKTMKKLLRNMEKQKNETKSVHSQKAEKNLSTRGILKDVCVSLCTGENTALGYDNTVSDDDGVFSYATEFNPHIYYGKTYSDKNVTFNTQVLIIHFMGDICVGQSVETLNKEKDQQARNSELRKTFITKYNEFWTT